MSQSIILGEYLMPSSEAQVGDQGSDVTYCWLPAHSSYFYTPLSWSFCLQDRDTEAKPYLVMFWVVKSRDLAEEGAGLTNLTDLWSF